MFFVIAQDGQRYGPVDLATLNEWAKDHRVVPKTILEGADGQRIEAESVPGMVFPTDSTSSNYGSSVVGIDSGYSQPGNAPENGTPGYGAPGYGMPGYGTPGYGTPGMDSSGYAPYPHQQGTTFGDNGQKDFTVSVIFTVLNLVIGWLCCPLIFGIISIIFGNNAKKKGHPNGNAAFIAAIVVTAIMVGLSVFVGIGGAIRGVLR